MLQHSKIYVCWCLGIVYVVVAVASELLVLVVFIIVWSGGVCSSTAALVSACMVGSTWLYKKVQKRSVFEVGDWRLEIGRSARGW